MLLILFGLVALGSLFFEALRASTVERHRIFVVLILMFFSMLFWAFFEQAGSSVSNFTDRNVDRVAEDYRVDDSHLGKRLELELTQEQLGFAVGGQTSFRLNHLQAARDAERAQLEKLTAEAKEKKQEIQKSELQLQAAKGTSTVDVMLDKAHMGMGVAVAGAEVPASVFQAANPIFIMIFGLLFTALWAFLAKRRIEPSIPVKFALGLIQLGLGFIAFWYGAEQADDRGMVWMGWLLLGYLLHTTGELCISPVGLSMVVKLSPKRIVATVMGAWFLATAFSNYLAAIIATLTGVEEEAETKGDIPIPAETLDLYSDVFLKVGIAAGVAAILLLVLSPLLNRWMHHGEEGDEGAPPPAGH
jgi:POT family proton-dependent oligopeptide transporter